MSQLQTDPHASVNESVGDRVTLDETGDVFFVESGETILSAALKAGVNLAHDCKGGTCGACRFNLLDGEVDYAEPPFGLMPEDVEAGIGLACSARPVGDVTIDATVLPPVYGAPARHNALIRMAEPLCDGVTRLLLELPEPVAEDYRPGQYLDILLDGEARRSFSLAALPDGNAVELHVRTIAGGRFTDGLLPRLAAGDRLAVELPRGIFHYRPEDFRPLLMLATGTGIAPMRAIVQSVLSEPGHPPVALYWGGRTEADLYLDAEFRRLTETDADFTYVPVLSRASTRWSGRRGHVQEAAVADIDDLSEVAAYLCGSPLMVTSARALLIAEGASVNHIYTDAFVFQNGKV
ncbi:MAG: ascD [Proteobacteria bacterium]|nr:ascD [Pseudomonadota bacterium]